MRGLPGALLAGLFSACASFVEPEPRLGVRRWKVMSKGWRGVPRRIARSGGDFRLAGPGDQLALIDGLGRFSGVDHVDGLRAQNDHDEPAILLAHQPKNFPCAPGRVALTLAGNIHGGQVRRLGCSPLVPSAYRNRFARGRVREEDRDLVVSGRGGCSILPARLGFVPETTFVEIGA